MDGEFTFGAEKLPATFNYANNTLNITVDTTNSKLITDETSALKKAKEYGAIKTPKPVGMPANPNATATPTA